MRKISARAARAITIAAVTAASLGGATAYAVAQAQAPQRPAVTCDASQPVYSNNDYKPVGTFHATLVPGQEVFLPDADVATCKSDGSLDIEQP